MVKGLIFLSLLLAVILPAGAEARTFYSTKNWTFFVAQKEDRSLASIASKLNLDERTLREWNGIKDGYVLKPGDILKVKNAYLKEEIKKKKKKKKQPPKKKQREQRPKKKKPEEIAIARAKKNGLFEAIIFASNKTGVRPAFLAGMFFVETGMGGNTGTRHYTNCRMEEEEQVLFLKICKRLGKDPDKTLVSANQPGQNGGAMGVAQFMPSTWVQYEKRIKRVVGTIPNPWDPHHAAIAMALKVSTDSPGVKSKNHKIRRRAEINAAKIYLSNTTLKKYNGHARKVLVAAKKLEKYFIS